MRELFEETGWRGEIISLFCIRTNPDRPQEDRQNVALEFLVRPVKKTGMPDAESSKVEWIAFTDLLPFDRFAFDHGDSIKRYLQYRQNPFPLPILV
ncbi:hypothetical protein A2154_02590 [Candidatus Gottesmanbacteria bacterium RBG_16_43_7]|uniref:Nudix hydrolase domain-containing protein n=1 Tax=Candidatus Gottesmanbacteria bacterium RBG_16_43_7 TaxID=1798373 RepID=A0A1F5ZDD2_9BACT|nr:MAG: hypothetical protein A2154_02590 [Candidatus Gottesmanbacteria bacterium RBG_16_43_7]